MASPHTLEGLWPGVYAVRAAAPEHVPAERTVRVETDRSTTVRLRLQRPGALVVEGEPVGARAELLDGAGETLGNAGLPLSASNLTPGRYRVRVTRKGYQGYDEVHGVVEGRETRVRVVLRRTGVRPPSETDGQAAVPREEELDLLPSEPAGRDLGGLSTYLAWTALGLAVAGAGAYGGASYLLFPSAMGAAVGAWALSDDGDETGAVILPGPTGLAVTGRF